MEDHGAVLDLNYVEDSQAMVDMNIIMTGEGEFVELQGTGEEATFTMNQLQELLELGQTGIRELFDIQKDVLGELADRIQ